MPEFPTSVSIDVDTQLYPFAAVMRAAYKFTGQYHVGLRRPEDVNEPKVMVTLTPKSSGASVDDPQLTGDFLNELLDQAMRERLEAEFGPVRELIVAQAFSETNLLDPARDEGDYDDDPLKIGRDAPPQDK
jgi:His-Xaa-Ser system protein HxsD